MFLQRSIISLAVVVVTAALLAPALAGASPESRAEAKATAAEVDGAVAAINALRAQGAAADPNAVRAAGNDLRTATGRARRLLDGYVRERGPVGDLNESATVVAMVKRIRLGRTGLRHMTGVNAVPRATRSQRNRLNRRARAITRALVARRAKELGLDDVLTNGAERSLRAKAESRIRSIIRRESPNILVEATAASLFLGGNPGAETDRLVRERVNGLVTRLVLNANPLERIALRLIGADRIVNAVVRRTLPIISWGPRQIVGAIRRVGRLNLSQRANRSTRGLRALAAELRREGLKGISTAKEAEALVRRAERAAAATTNLRDQLKRSGRDGQLKANTGALGALFLATKIVEERFGLQTELYARRRGIRNELIALESEIGGMLDGWDGTVRTGGSGGGVPGGGGGTPAAGRATQASCLGPIQVDNGVFTPNIKPYAVVDVSTTTGSVTCRYAPTDDSSAKGPSLTIWFGGDWGRCDEASLDPIRDGTGTWHSTRRRISAIVIGTGFRIDAPPDFMTQVIRSAEGEGAGTSCPRGAPV